MHATFTITWPQGTPPPAIGSQIDLGILGQGKVESLRCIQWKEHADDRPDGTIFGLTGYEATIRLRPRQGFVPAR